MEPRIGCVYPPVAGIQKGRVLLVSNDLDAPPHRSSQLRRHLGLALWIGERFRRPQDFHGGPGSRFVDAKLAAPLLDVLDYRQAVFGCLDDPMDQPAVRTLQELWMLVRRCETVRVGYSSGTYPPTRWMTSPSNRLYKYSGYFLVRTLSHREE